MYQHILVALDGSESSALAMDHAIQLAKDQRARLRLVHVIDPSVYATAASGGYPFDVTPVIEGLRQAGRQILADAEAKARGAEVQSESELLESGDPSERIATIIVKDARRWRADLIVLGTHGRRGFNRIVLGSVAEGLVRMATTPVLVVRVNPKLD